MNRVISGFRRGVKSSLFWDVSSVGWYLVTDVSGQPTGPIFEDLPSRVKKPKKTLDFLVLEGRTDRTFPDVGY